VEAAALKVKIVALAVGLVRFVAEGDWLAEAGGLFGYIVQNPSWPWQRENKARSSRQFAESGSNLSENACANLITEAWAWNVCLITVSSQYP
jgi:hypothetical protein